MADLSYSDRFWTKWYRMLGLPEELPEPQCSTLESIYRVWTEKVPADRVALVCGGYEMSAGEMVDAVDRTAAALRGLGREKGDVVASLLGNGIPFCVAMLGALCAHLTWQPISPLQKTPEIERQLREGGARTLICYPGFLDQVEALKERTAVEDVIVASERDFTAVQDGAVADPPGARQLRNLLARSEPVAPTFEWRDDETAVLLFTGGATGVPKGVQLSMGNFNFLNQVISGLLGPLEEVLTGNLGMVIAQHLYHIGLGMMVLGLRLGCTLYIAYDPRDTRTIYHYLTKPGVFFALFAPGQIGRLLEAEGLDLSRLKHIIPLSGMAALSPETGTRYMMKTGTSPFQAYGQTESTGLITLNLPAFFSALGLGRVLGSPLARKVSAAVMPSLFPYLLRALAFQIRLIGAGRFFGSSNHRVMSFLHRRARRGRDERAAVKAIRSIGIPLWNTDVKIVDADDGRTPVPVGEVGELCFRGAQRMKGYLETEEGYAGPGYDEEGFVHTGDLAYMDEDGLLFLVDRVKDMINVSGFKVYGTTVENVVYRHPAVALCAAFAVPDEGDPLNERVKVVVQLREGFEPGRALEEEIIGLCEEGLPPYAKPRQIEFVEKMPMLHTEKVDKLFLRQREARRREEGGPR